MLGYCFDRQKTQKICDKAAADYLLTLKFVADWFVTSKIIEKSHNAVFSKYDIILSYIDSDIVTFLRSHISLDSINLNNTNIDDGNLDDYDPESINHSRHLA